MLKEFKAFITRGNVIDFAVGIIVGAAFGRIITSLVNDIVMPPIGLLLGGVNFTNLFIALNGKRYTSLTDAQAAGAPTINYGMFINNVIDFLIVAMAVFILVRIVQRLLPPPPSQEMRECPHCLSKIPKGARRCAHCTSKVEAEVEVEARAEEEKYKAKEEKDKAKEEKDEAKEEEDDDAQEEEETKKAKKGKK